jgi:hypothetical protein
MAINDNTSSNQNYTTAPQAAPMNQQPQQPKRTMSFMKLGTMGGLSRASSSENLSRAIAALAEEVKKTTEKPWEVTLLPVDNSKETNLSFSGIVFVVRRLDALERGLAYHTLILEGSDEALASKIESYQGTQFEIMNVTGNAYNETYAKTVYEIVSRAFPNVVAHPVDAQVVPREFNFEVKDAVHALTLNAQLPCYTAIETLDKTFMDMDLTAFEKDSTLAVRLGFNEPQKTDYAGLPVRNDVSITLSAASILRSAAVADPNAQDRTKMIATIGGYIDPIFVQTDQNQMMMMNPNMPNPKFAIRFVMTNMENVAQTTLSSQLLAFTAAMALRENSNWFPYFAPRPMGAGHREVDLRDIGAINIEGNIQNNPNGFAPYEDTKAASFGQRELAMLLQASFRPGMTFSLRVSECGSDTWYNSAFKAAADNHPGAIHAILTAANTLTGGAFAPIYNSNENPVVVNYDRVHMGYYVGPDGMKRDIADIDYLAMMNLVGKVDPSVGAKWSNTFFREDQPVQLRLSDRKRMIESAIKTEVTYTGFGRLVTFTNRFIDSLAKACAQAGLDIRTINPNITGDYFSQRASASFLGQSQVMPGSSGLFNQGYGSPQNQFQDPRGYYGRTW